MMLATIFVAVSTMTKGTVATLLFEEPSDPVLRVFLNGKEVLVGKGKIAVDPDRIWSQIEDIELSQTSDFSSLELGDTLLDTTLLAAENNEIRVEIDRGGMKVFRSLRIVRKENSTLWKLRSTGVEATLSRFIRRDDADVYFDQIRE